ncbi:MAG: hypothetical protein E7260_02875 [Lachnospiraceae bacterium]|nr:hypothetical protein [Lachnospiraceae bacterium]
MTDNKQEQNILVIGNGFDLYHYLPTRYIDFINVIKRLLELDHEQRLQRCSYVNYMFGAGSPLYSDEHIKKCYQIHGNRMKSVELKMQRIERLVEISKANVWIRYFLKMCSQNIGWIDFEKEMAQVINAITNFFDRVSSNENSFLQKGINIDDNVLSRSDIDILMRVPFYEEHEERLKVKDEFYVRAIEGEKILRIDETKIVNVLEKDLEELAEALCIYLEQFVQSIAIDRNSDNPLFYKIDEVINFNYTDTYSRLYSKDTKVFYVHGSMNEIENGIVLGINADKRDQSSNMDLRFVKFKKYYQRIQKGTSFRIRKMLNENNINHLHIVGHSLDITDKDILTGLMLFENTITTVYYHSDKAKNEQIEKLILLFGKEKFEELLDDEKIELQKLQDFNVSNLQDTGMEEYELYEDDYFEYSMQRDCRIIEEDKFSGTILCGNELVKVGVREEGGLGYAEMEIVDYFLWRVERFNHSGKYKGVVVADDFFNDDRYGPVSVSIKYLMPEGTDRDITEEELKKLLDTEFKCNPMFVYEVKFDTI